MSRTLSEILGGESMTAVMSSIEGGVPNVLPGSFMKVTRRVLGNTASYLRSDASRQAAFTSQYGAPARVIANEPLHELSVALAHVFEQKNHNPLLLQQLSGDAGEQQQALAMQEIDRQTAEFKRRCINARLAAIHSALANGTIWLDGEGRIQTTAIGAAVTVDFGVPQTNTGDGDGRIAASWATNTTTIIDHIAAIKTAQVQAGKPPLKYAFYGRNIAGYLAGNEQASELLNRTDSLASQYYYTGDVPDGFAGLTWRPAYMAFALDAANDAQPWFGEDALVLTPEPSPEWWQIFEGSYLAPRGLGNVSDDANAAASDVTLVYGMFSYATLSHNPVTVTQFAGDTFLPVIGDPEAVWILDVTP